MNKKPISSPKITPKIRQSNLTQSKAIRQSSSARRAEQSITIRSDSLRPERKSELSSGEETKETRQRTSEINADNVVQARSGSSESSKNYMDELPAVTEASELDAMLHRALTQRDTFGKYLLAVAGINQADLQAVVVSLRQALQANTTKFAQSKGLITDQRDVIDWQSRLSAIEKWIRLLDLYGPKSDRPGSHSARVLKVEVDLAPDLKRNRGLRSGPDGTS